MSPESECNVSSEEQKNNTSNQTSNNEFKTPMATGSNVDSNANQKINTSYICLDNGKVIIKGNQIETMVPCDIETLNKNVSMICPHYPVKISILPLAYNQPHVYDHKSQSFTSRDSNNNDGIFVNTNSLSSTNKQSSQGIF